MQLKTSVIELNFKREVLVKKTQERPPSVKRYYGQERSVSMVKGYHRSSKDKQTYLN
jgi:hypothetical protein